MKFIKIRPSGKDQHIPVFEFAFGEEELKIIKSLIANSLYHTPDIFEHTPIRHTMQSMSKCMSDVIKEYRKGKLKL